MSYRQNVQYQPHIDGSDSAKTSLNNILNHCKSYFAKIREYSQTSNLTPELN